MILVTSYKNPDIDGIACSVAYAELLNLLGKKAKAIYFGKLTKETEFVIKLTNYFPIENYDNKDLSGYDFVFVDTDNTDAVNEKIDPLKVLEIIDHHKTFKLQTKFPNTKVEIELIGACATHIAQRYKENNLVPSKEIAIYLYSGIVSNTVNFKNSITSKKDIGLAIWLKSIAQINEGFVVDMFNFKSPKSFKEIKENLLQDFNINKYPNSKSFVIHQLETTNLEDLIRSHVDKLQEWMLEDKNKYKLNGIIFSGIDILGGYNIFVTMDKFSQEILAKLLGLPKVEPIQKINYIIMRKQIKPKLEEVLCSYPALDKN